MRVNAPFKSHSCNTFLLTVSCWGDIALFQGGSAYGLQANVGGGNFALTRLRPERQCCGRLWSRIPPRTLWSVQTKWTRGLPGGAGCCGARTSRTPANGLRRWLSLASLLQALRGSLSQPCSAASLSLVTAARPRIGRMLNRGPFLRNLWKTWKSRNFAGFPGLRHILGIGGRASFAF